MAAYLWELDIPAAAVAVRVYDDSGTLLVMDASGNASLSISGDLLAGFKAYLRRADGGEMDAMLSLLLLSAQATLGKIMGATPDTSSAEQRVWMYSLAAGIFASPESHSDRPITESSAFRFLTDSLRGYAVG